MCILHSQLGWSNLNDLLNTDGIIDQNLIFNKLHNKTNYLTEIHTLLQSIPKHWNTLLKSEASRKSKVRTTTDIYLNGTPLKTINTKLVYKALLKNKSTKPLTNRFWIEQFGNTIELNNVFKFIKQIPNNRHKQYKFRVLNRIFTSRGATPQAPTHPPPGSASESTVSSVH